MSELKSRLNQFVPHDGTRWSTGVKLYALELARKAAKGNAEIPVTHLTGEYLMDRATDWHKVQQER